MAGEAMQDLRQSRPLAILAVEDRIGDRPLDADLRIVPAHADLVVGGVESVHLYCTTAESPVTQKPWTKPGGTQSWQWLSPERMALTQRPKVGEPGRMSTATSKISPARARTSLPCGLWSCACRPRRTWRRENDWLSCTKVPGRPAASNLSR